MSVRTLVALVLALLPCFGVAAQERAVRRLPLRVSSSAAGAAVTVDRGSRDRIEVGDEVLFFPRAGGTYRGVVRSVDERRSTVELVEKRYVPVLGTRGEALVPAERFAPPPEEKPQPQAQDPEQGDPDRYENKDEEYEDGMPLLAEVKPVRPRDRPKLVRGRVFLIGDLVYTPEDGGSDSFFRGGADVRVENPFGKGGEFRVDAELDLLTEQSDNTGLDALLRRLSYRVGGTRFEPQRFEIGRFLQSGMPEFGIIDGVEWGVRQDGGNRVGASVGFMPEPDDDFESFQDLQFAAYYGIAFDERENTTFTLGFQKTFHSGKSDRDLLVFKGRHLFENGWDLHGVGWVDFYFGDDNIKDSAVELTQGLLSATRQWKSGSGMSVTLSHMAFPELRRTGEFTPLLPQGIADNRNDRLALDWWRVASDRARIHGHISGYNDEEDSGGAVDLGLELADLIGDRSHVDFTVLGVAGQFSTDAGVRVTYDCSADNGRWDALYEVLFRHNSGFPADSDDFLQHRLRVSRTLRAGLWDVDLHAEGYIWDDDIAGSLGFYLQRSF